MPVCIFSFELQNDLGGVKTFLSLIFITNSFNILYYKITNVLREFSFPAFAWEYANKVNNDTVCLKGLKFFYKNNKNFFPVFSWPAINTRRVGLILKNCANPWLCPFFHLEFSQHHVYIRLCKILMHKKLSFATSNQIQYFIQWDPVM